MRDRESLLNLGVLLIVAAGTALFLVHQADRAVAEIEALANVPIYRGLHDTATDEQL